MKLPFLASINQIRVDNRRFFFFQPSYSRLKLLLAARRAEQGTCWMHFQDVHLWSYREAERMFFR